MADGDAQDLAINNLERLMNSYSPIFAASTPQKTGRAADSITVEKRDDSVIMKWGTDYIDDVNRNEGKSQGFANDQFRSVRNRIDIQAKKEIELGYKATAKRNKLKVKK